MYFSCGKDRLAPMGKKGYYHGLDNLHEYMMTGFIEDVCLSCVVTLINKETKRQNQRRYHIKGNLIVVNGMPNTLGECKCC